MATSPGPQTEARKIYICNAEDDEEPARLLADYLRSEGWDVYRLSGDPYAENLGWDAEDYIREADAVVVLWTPSSVGSRSVRDEARIALLYDKLVSLPIAGTEPPDDFLGAPTVDLGGAPGNILASPGRISVAFVELNDVLRHVAERRTGSAPPEPTSPSEPYFEKSLTSPAAPDPAPFESTATTAPPTSVPEPAPINPPLSIDELASRRADLQGVEQGEYHAPDTEPAGQPDPAPPSEPEPQPSIIDETELIRRIDDFQARASQSLHRLDQTREQQFYEVRELLERIHERLNQVEGEQRDDLAEMKDMLETRFAAQDREIDAMRRLREPTREEPNKAADAEPKDLQASDQKEAVPKGEYGWRGLGRTALAAGLGAAAGAALIYYDVLSKFTALVGVWMNALPPVPAARPEETDAGKEDLDCSVFGPSVVPPGATFMVQVFLHSQAEEQAVGERAVLFDDQAVLRGVRTLKAEIARGDRLTILFDCPDMDADEIDQEIVWQGRARSCAFLVTAPDSAKRQDYFPTIRVLLNGTPIGRIKFKLTCDPQAAAADARTDPQGDSAQRYSYAFLSYSRHDRSEVLKRAQALSAVNIDFFQDILSLDPGDRWEKKLYEHIDRCDVFLLFWSNASKRSKWVRKEVEHALIRERETDGEMPDIIPIIVDSRNSPSPWPEIADRHINDRISQFIAASQLN